MDHVLETRENKNRSQEKRKLLPLQLVNEFLYVLVTLIKCIRTNVDLAKLAEFFSPLSSVLEYRAVIAEALREMKRFTVNDSVLSSRELLLLHKWSLICKDMQLQEDLQALAQKYQNKELLKNIKDKSKPQASSHVHHHTQRKNEVGEDKAAADMKVPELEKCREHLNSILAQWDPVFPAPPSPQGGETLRAELFLYSRFPFPLGTRGLERRSRMCYSPLSDGSALVQVMNYRMTWKLGNKEKKRLCLFAKKFGYIRALIQGTDTSSLTFCALPSSL